MIVPVVTLGVGAWRELEAYRRRSRVRGLGIWGLLFRAYVGLLLGGALALFSASWLSQPYLARSAVIEVATHGPGILGGLMGLAMLAGARTGRAGGPIWVDAPTVRHVLLSPLPRATVLRRLARAAVVRVLGFGIAVGVLAGWMAADRLAGSAFAWLAVGGAFVGLVASTWLGSALILAARPRRMLLGVPALLLVWAVVDAAAGTRLSPFAALGAAVLSPFPDLAMSAWSPTTALGGIVTATAAIAGVMSIPALSIERMEQRSRLVSMLRFSLAMRDLRAVVLFRRRLVGESRRRGQWLPMSAGGRWPVWSRDWAGAMRWPAIRLVRIMAAGIGVALTTAMAVSGTRLFLVVAAVLQFAAAVEATEGLAEDVDHPTLRRGLPRHDGAIWLAHLPAAVMILGAANLAGVACLALTGGVDAAALLIVLPAATVACAAAGWVAIREPLSPDDLLLDDLGFLQAKYVMGPVAWGGIGPISIVVAYSHGKTGASLWLAAVGVTTVAAVASVLHLYYRDRAARTPLGRAVLRAGLR